MRLLHLFIILLLVPYIAAFSEPVPLVRVWGSIQNSTEHYPNCNLLDSLVIERNGEDATYTSAFGFYDEVCYYSLDIDASTLEEDDILKIVIQGVESTPFTYSSGDILQEDVIVDLPSEYFSFITGGMDETADNYEPSVNYDDGSCEYLGCTDSDAYNYDASANVDDDSCMYAGCTDPDALNYDEDATLNQGCEYPEDSEEEEDTLVYGCVEESATNYNPEATDDDGSCLFEEPEEEPEQQ
jgi:hypothetical protein